MPEEGENGLKSLYAVEGLGEEVNLPREVLLVLDI